MTKLLPVLVLIVLASQLPAQEISDSEAAIAVPSRPPERALVKLRDFQTILMTSLREKFPRLPGIFYSAHSCRLPEYGPVFTLTLQLPAIYFTQPLMRELEKQKKIAEEQASIWRAQIERQAQMITLRARESELVQRIDVEFNAKRRSKTALNTFQEELLEIRKNLKELEASPGTSSSPSAPSALLSDVDLEKMLAANYQQLIQKITSTVTNVLAEKSPVLADLNNSERITVTAHIRESFVSSQERSIIFTLRNSDIDAFRSGSIDLNTLKQRVEVRDEPPE